MNCKMSSNTAHEVKTAFDAMVGGLNVNFDNANNFTSSELLDTVWEVSIEFEDKRNLKEHHEDSLLLSGISEEEAQSGMVVQAITNDLTPDEEAYINEVKECSEEGEIGPREWRLLNKIRERLGISEERARELEKFVTPSLSAEEQEYIKEYKEIISDGEISARDQRFLDKLKKANGISEERAKEIESMA